MERLKGRSIWWNSWDARTEMVERLRSDFVGLFNFFLKAYVWLNIKKTNEKLPSAYVNFMWSYQFDSRCMRGTVARGHSCSWFSLLALYRAPRLSLALLIAFYLKKQSSQWKKKTNTKLTGSRRRRQTQEKKSSEEECRRGSRRRMQTERERCKNEEKRRSIHMELKVVISHRNDLSKRLNCNGFWTLSEILFETIYAIISFVLCYCLKASVVR